MIDGAKTVLVADDDPATCWMYQRSLPDHLPGFRVATVGHGQEAIDFLSAVPVAVLVTDIAMPVKDGFDLLAHVQNHHPNLPVVVIAAIAPRSDAEAAPSRGTLRLLRKPVPPAELAEHVLAAYHDAANGGLAGVSLVPLLRLVQAERKSCALHLRSGERSGRLHFVAGELVNAYAADLALEGEDAARHLLGFDNVTIAFERSRHDHVRRISTPLETLLHETGGGPADVPGPQAPIPDAAEPVVVPAPPAPEPPAPPEAHATPAPPLAPPAPEPPEASSAPVERAADDLQDALARLRQRSRHAARSLADAVPALHDGTRALATARRDDAANAARTAESWHAISTLASRLARVTEALGPDPEADR